MMQGVLDRFEGNLAVILIEEDKAELIIPKEKLPEGSHVDTIFEMEKRNSSYHIIAINTEAEKRAKEKTTNLLAQLRTNSTGSKFKKN
ncbi:DUF3006 domain-containing protein [Ornithinibacillus sp. BX22]|uniref:DUF3006 domain-containing protein n=1 Tax=Ornithinibacillus hominis TaxID=2763055 RepID=A0A923L7A0_9BACI|nr:DUF3006 domain-containing protein [Ornithinibacillus hominis]MBC5637754.1 DUF3006 domain-containing protein [Ornithinibacillus hominis]